MTEIKKEDSRFVLLINGEEAGEMTFNMRSDNIMVIEHTGIDRNYEGHGYAKQLLAYVVNYVTENNIKIVPLCPFVRAEFNKNDSYKKVWA